jgi:hypothetical protein
VILEDVYRFLLSETSAEACDVLPSFLLSIG